MGNRSSELTERNQKVAHSSCSGNAKLRTIDVRTHDLDLSSETTDRLVDNRVEAEVNVSEWDDVALGCL
jgi:hypothetical protein